MMELAPTRFLVVAAALLCFACSSTKPTVRPADDIYQSARENHDKEYYDAAIGDYKELLDNYPLDPRAEEIELLIAQAHYSNESYPEAIAAFSDFQRMHPTSPKLPEVEYTIGQAYMDQTSTIDRDLNSATNASKRFESVMLRYPHSEHAEKARGKLHDAREYLAGRELYIAEFYYRGGHPRAARGRVLELIVKYPETSSASEGLARLEEDAKSSDDAELAGLAAAARTECIAAAEAATSSTTDPAAAARALAAPSPPGPATADVIRVLRERQGRPQVASAPTPASP